MNLFAFLHDCCVEGLTVVDVIRVALDARRQRARNYFRLALGIFSELKFALRLAPHIFIGLLVIVGPSIVIRVTIDKLAVVHVRLDCHVPSDDEVWLIGDRYFYRVNFDLGGLPLHHGDVGRSLLGIAPGVDALELCPRWIWLTADAHLELV